MQHEGVIPITSRGIYQHIWIIHHLIIGNRIGLDSDSRVIQTNQGLALLEARGQLDTVKFHGHQTYYSISYLIY